MKMRSLLIVICASLLLTACGGAGIGTGGGPGKLTFKFKMIGNDVTKELTVKQGSVFVNDIVPKQGSSLRPMDYFINLANYDFPQKASEAYPKKDGDILIVIQVLGDKDATEKLRSKPETIRRLRPRTARMFLAKPGICKSDISTKEELRNRTLMPATQRVRAKDPSRSIQLPAMRCRARSTSATTMDRSKAPSRASLIRSSSLAR